MLLKILSCENPSNIWELNYRAHMCGANKLTGKMVLILPREEWISLFGHSTFQRYVIMLSTRFVRTSRNGLSHKTWSHFLFARHLEAYLMLGVWWTCLPHDKCFLCWRLKNQYLKLIVITFCKKRPSCDREIKPGLLATWSHKHAGKHMVSANNCCLQLSNSSFWESVSVTFLDIFCWIHWGRIHWNNCCLQLSNSSFWESVSVTFLDIFCWIHWGTISEFHWWLWAINSHRHHNFGGFVNTLSVCNS